MNINIMHMIGVVSIFQTMSNIEYLKFASYNISKIL